MRLKIAHTTRYAFDEPAAHGLQQVRKTPKSNASQSLLSWETSLEGGKREVSFEDHHHNTVELISFERDTTELVYRCEGAVDLTDTQGITGRHRGPSPLWLYKRTTPLTKPGRGVRSLVRDVEGETELTRLHDLSGRIRAAVAYEIGASAPDWDAETVLTEALGVCQDHTHVFLACARAMGIPARYVSGYLMLDDRATQDAMHAWAEAHVPGLGWVGFDVSNSISPDTRYVRVATGLDYKEAAPITGARVGGTGETLSVEIEVAQQ